MSESSRRAEPDAASDARAPDDPHALADRRAPDDPRVARTLRALEKTAVDVLRADGWPALTTARLCRTAGVARSTFYEHYKAPSEPVFAWLLRRFFESFPEYAGAPPRLDPRSLLASKRPLSYPVFAHVEENMDVYRRVLGEPAGAAVARRFEAAVADVSRAQHAALRELSSVEVDAELTAAYLAGAAVASARVWIASDPRPSATEMAYWFSRMAAPGLLEVMGLEELLNG